MELDRRQFLLGSMLAAGGVASAGMLGGCSAPAASEKKEETAAVEEVAAEEGYRYSGEVRELHWSWDNKPPVPTEDQIAEEVECEILIVGAGIAGAPAGMLAAEQGADVVFVEKVATWGNKRFGTAGFNSRTQLAEGIEYDRTEVVKSLWNVTYGFQGRIPLFGKWFDNSTAYLNWLEDLFEREFGYQWHPVYKSAGQGLFWYDYNIRVCPGDFPTEDVPWMDLMMQYALDHGARIYYNMPAEQIILDDDGVCTGVYCINEEGKCVRFTASKGVLLAAGDYFTDKEMLQCYAPLLLGCSAGGETKNTGDLHKAGLWIGADMDTYAAGDVFPCNPADTSQNWSTMRPLPEEDPYYTATQGAGWQPCFSMLPGLVTDVSGRRIIPEYYGSGAFSQSFNLGTLSSPIREGMDYPTIWTIWNQAWVENLPEGMYTERGTLYKNTPEQMEKEVAAGLIKTAETADELAKLCDFDPDIFRQTLERYNMMCHNGEDLDCLKPVEWLTPFDEGPFYAVETLCTATGSRGGLKINDNMNVVKTDGKPIKNLYAAGNCAGGFYGMAYPQNFPGSGVGHGQCFGWMAVKTMLGMELA